jgi:hypothetical protein
VLQLYTADMELYMEHACVVSCAAWASAVQVWYHSSMNRKLNETKLILNLVQVRFSTWTQVMPNRKLCDSYYQDMFHEFIQKEYITISQMENLISIFFWNFNIWFMQHVHTFPHGPRWRQTEIVWFIWPGRQDMFHQFIQKGIYCIKSIYQNSFFFLEFRYMICATWSYMSHEL